MKKSLFVLGIAAVLFVSCGEKKKEEVKKEVETKVETVKEEVKTEVAAVDNIELGKKLFAEKTCATCHQPDAKVIGPSIKEIVKVYAEQKGNIVTFLKGEAEAIVDKDPGQVAIMKANLDGFVKDMSGDELAAVAAYMRSVK
ncbi:c-type cytochrome [Lutibacter sp. TH_r2]|uniref:c-type cytochrome n=1 Tax=Lutibacter sp. TH_r2 TaxID=3082083 RepID=UPI002954D790|nr:c-type cytochrome [Lutibacter sp. TH_r2]MDV7187396.1 c-type cytochrome [Lutibacter sp. TH_r2]